MFDNFSFLFSQEGGYLRIPIWGHIPLNIEVRKIIEHTDFVRLQRIRQLGFVHYVFPGATHTRFEHSIGTYHLALLMLQRLVMNPSNMGHCLTPEEARLFLAASLLHDIGHYPFAHLVDRITEQRLDGSSKWFDTHEDRARDYILGDKSAGSIYSILRDEWKIDNPAEVVKIIEEPYNSGLPGRMLSGILDPDKMDYLMRDAWNCAVPYGNIDVERLIESLAVDMNNGNPRLGITDKGVAPLESLIFAKYMMFRHIYWHHAIRIAVAMFTRFVQDALEDGELHPEVFYDLSDDALIEYLAEISSKVPSGSMMLNLKDRNLYKRGLTFFAEHAVGEDEFTIEGQELNKVKELHSDPARRKEKETAICEMLSSEEGIALQGFEVLLDIPRISSVFDVEDFKELRVLIDSQTDGSSKFAPFNTYGFTQLTADFVQEFERFSRRVQVVCRPDIKEIAVKNWRDIKSIVVS